MLQRLLLWLLAKFPDDNWLAKRACELGVHQPDYIDFKRDNIISYKWACTNCRKKL